MSGIKNIEAIAADCLSRKGQYRDERMAALKRQDKQKYDEVLSAMVWQMLFAAICDIATQQNKVDKMREENRVLMKLGGVQ